MADKTMTLEPDGYVVLLHDKKSSPRGFARDYLTNESAMELASKNALAEVRPFVFADTHAAEIERLSAELEKCREDAERMRTELGRAYRALAAYTHARDHGQPLPDHAVAYHSLTEAAAKRFVSHGALDGSEYFIGKSVDVLHAALRGESEGSKT